MNDRIASMWSLSSVIRVYSRGCVSQITYVLNSGDIMSVAVSQNAVTWINVFRDLCLHRAHLGVCYNSYPPNWPVPAPVMSFPMDVINGNRVLGTMDGTLEGGVNLGVGLQGKAIYLDGQLGSRVNYGVHTAAEGCFFDPEQCRHGTAFSFWLKLDEVLPAGFSSALDNGGCRPQGIGFCLFSFTAAHVDFTAVVRTQAHIYSVPHPPVSQWHLFAITYIRGDIKVYINDCDTKPFATMMIAPRKQPYAENAIFYMGDSPVVPAANGPQMAMDELKVWYSVLTAEEIWALYVQGGRV